MITDTDKLVMYEDALENWQAAEQDRQAAEARVAELKQISQNNSRTAQQFLNDKLKADARAEQAEARLGEAQVMLKGAEIDRDQIEALFPDWKGYRDLVDCITVTLHRLRGGRDE